MEAITYSTKEKAVVAALLCEEDSALQSITIEKLTLLYKIVFFIKTKEEVENLVAKTQKREMKYEATQICSAFQFIDGCEDYFGCNNENTI